MDKYSKTGKSGIFSHRTLDPAGKKDNEAKIPASDGRIKSQSLFSSPKLIQSKSQSLVRGENEKEVTTDLSRSVIIEKSKGQTLSTSMKKLNSQNKNQKILVEELKNEKDKLAEQMHYMRKKFTRVQNQRNTLFADVGRLRNQISGMRAIIFTDEDKIFTLEQMNRKMIDELNFEKEVSADYRKENLVMKAQVKNILNAFANLKQILNCQKDKQLINIKTALNNKISELKTNIQKLKDEFKEIKDEQGGLVSYKKQFMEFIVGVQLNNQALKTQVNNVRQFGQNQIISKYTQLCLVQEMEYKKIIQGDQEKIKKLSSEITGLKKNINQLKKQLQEKQKMKEKVEQGDQTDEHTDTSYVNKVIKDSERQILQFKDLVEMKDGEINRLKEMVEMNDRNSNAKSQEIESLTIKLKALQNNKFNGLNNQIDDLKAEKLRLTRKIDQLTQAQSSLKAQIVEKDKIIVNYVQKSKIKE